LDGTKQFVSRRGEFTVNIALIEDGQPVLGIVHAPALDATYWGSPLGAFARTDGAEARPIACRPMPKKGLIAVASRSHRNAATDAFLARYDIAEAISSGSSIKFCLVACGKADLYPRTGRTMEWDTAAGHAVVRFAGGTVTELDGKALTYGKPGFENPHFVVRGAAPQS
jgi:3'(2'), 5'-bisphosphate nucleotidase